MAIEILNIPAVREPLASSGGSGDGRGGLTRNGAPEFEDFDSLFPVYGIGEKILDVKAVSLLAKLWRFSPSEYGNILPEWRDQIQVRKLLDSDSILSAEARHARQIMASILVGLCAPAPVENFLQRFFNNCLLLGVQPQYAISLNDIIAGEERLIQAHLEMIEEAKASDFYRNAFCKFLDLSFEEAENQRWLADYEQRSSQP